MTPAASRSIKPLEQARSEGEVGGVESQFEAAWAKTGSSMGMAAQRHETYDAVNLLFHAPTTYEAFKIDRPMVKAPSPEWVSENFKALVLGELGRTSRGSCPSRTTVVSRSLDNQGVTYAYLLAAEKERAYSGFIDTLVEDRGITTTEKVLRVLSHEYLGNRVNGNYLRLQDLESKVRLAEERRLPLQFILPAFPFKDQNPFRTEASPDHVDLGEVALLIRLHVLALALWQVYPFGAEWIIVSDGVAYAPVFGVPIPSARLYQRRLREYRSRLNLENTVHLIDLDDMTRRLGRIRVSRSGRPTQPLDFQGLCRLMENTLEGVLGEDASVAERFRVFHRGLKWNVETRSLLEHYSWKELWLALNSARPNKSSSPELFEQIEDRTTRTALRYAAHNLTIKYVGVFERFFPNAIRATVHPKPGQVALPCLGDGDSFMSPWNGVAVMRGDEVEPSTIEVQPLFEVLRNQKATAVCLDRFDSPFLYRV